MIRLWLVFMRRTLLTLVILGLVWIGYIAWPIYDLLVLIRAIETRDVNTVTRHVYFEALSQLLTLGWPVTVVSDAPPPGTVGITTNTIGTIWQIFENSEYGFGRFEVAGPAALPPQQRFQLEFRLLQWHWPLVEVTLPKNIQNLLADELAKATRK